jgi:hypothetical protein
MGDIKDIYSPRWKMGDQQMAVITLSSSKIGGNKM